MIKNKIIGNNFKNDVFFGQIFGKNIKNMHFLIKFTSKKIFSSEKIFEGG